MIGEVTGTERQKIVKSDKCKSTRVGLHDLSASEVTRIHSTFNSGAAAVPALGLVFPGNPW